MRVGSFARVDVGRPRRTGVPEVILAEGKRPDQVVELLQALHDDGQGALVSRPGPEHTRALLYARAGGLPIRFRASGRVIELRGKLPRVRGSGRVAILTAGTADIPIAEEARAILEAVGVGVVAEFDVGVAGIHRLFRVLRRTERLHPRVYLVAAGREGALPTVVAGLVRAPVVGIPTSTGYGRGAGGAAALGAMLQSCAPVAVVNIDGGVSAALFAIHLLSAGRPRSSGKPI
jgi:pyridinium-3,5-biscarboxylic acid mononucleotide synthase